MTYGHGQLVATPKFTFPVGSLYSSMEDAENILPPSKKKVAARQLSKDNPEDSEEEVDRESGTFKKASEELLASRKIIKARRHQYSAAPSAPSSNPFAGIRLVPPAPSNAAPTEVTTEKQLLLHHNLLHISLLVLT
ncbi:hypothetical protein RJ639_017908 [Escallonia herrerae]|uniref:Nuclear pore complex NUP2/50/61 domain-containing protein n=1 Tax=Escallonia herrerae TaxID=1293975 RepID=A0AA88V866_9ASTE|nr:hypothetical protein RJ639_017908 [Escallonia herrerae]